MSIQVRKIDLYDHHQRLDYMSMLRAYSEDPLGQGKPLEDDVLHQTAADLATLPHAIAFVAYDLKNPLVSLRVLRVTRPFVPSRCGIFMISR